MNIIETKFNPIKTKDILEWKYMLYLNKQSFNLK